MMILSILVLEWSCCLLERCDDGSCFFSLGVLGLEGVNFAGGRGTSLTANRYGGASTVGGGEAKPWPRRRLGRQK